MHISGGYWGQDAVTGEAAERNSSQLAFRRLFESASGCWRARGEGRREGGGREGKKRGDEGRKRGGGGRGRIGEKEERIGGERGREERMERIRERREGVEGEGLLVLSLNSDNA